ncbi:Hypothetical_protein [Hexamita inflata]|uniref:Hypothetical_protein n=1 Tax=Hexamita inflata TaxID=28002 RepID=A0AA86S458_9EUKA|nr:Hypothetical protein HINF_LOCUS65365 [Hexamita inflata]
MNIVMFLKTSLIGKIQTHKEWLYERVFFLNLAENKSGRPQLPNKYYDNLDAFKQFIANFDFETFELSSKFRVAEATVDKLSDNAKDNLNFVQQIIRSSNGKKDNVKNFKNSKDKKKDKE